MQRSPQNVFLLPGIINLVYLTRWISPLRSAGCFNDLFPAWKHAGIFYDPRKISPLSAKSPWAKRPGGAVQSQQRCRMAGAQEDRCKRLGGSEGSLSHPQPGGPKGRGKSHEQPTIRKRFASAQTSCKAEGNALRVRHLSWPFRPNPLRGAFRCTAPALLCGRRDPACVQMEAVRVSVGTGGG